MFEVDKQGLAKLLERKGKRFIPLELIQNGMDEDGVTTIDVTIEAVPGKRGVWSLTVSDDAPAGFTDLTHAYTLFAESKKKVNPRLRGRWNLGEKLVIACCRTATIMTTTGTVVFDGKGRQQLSTKTGRGSVFTGELQMSRTEAEEAVDAARSVIVPPGITLKVNGSAVDCRRPFATVEIQLPTEIADADGYLRRSQRMTTLEVYEVPPTETPQLFELGIPVVELDCDWHVNISQKIPLNLDRDNVTPAYRRQILTAVANLMHGRLNQSTATRAWVDEALESTSISDEAVRSIIQARHGENVVSYDPSDPEGSKIAITRGYEVVHGGSYSGPQWENIRRAEALKPAGQVTPSPKPFSAGGSPLLLLPRADWNEKHLAFARYAVSTGRVLLGKDIVVQLANDPTWGFAAAYGDGQLTVNAYAFRDTWFGHDYTDVGAGDVLEQVDALLIHEFAHDRVSDHLSNKFHEECCRLGAKLARSLRKQISPEHK